MKKVLLLFLLFCLAFGNLRAQSESQLTKTWTVGLELIGLDFIGEFPVSERATFRVSAAGFLHTARVEVIEEDFTTRLGLRAVGTATYRYYYRIKDINRKGKPLLFNSGNFIFGEFKGSQVMYQKRPDDFQRRYDDFNTTVGAGWGIQRMYRNGFVFSLGIGPGYDILEQHFTWIGELTLGIRLNQRN